jgi:o-succinylbenzoate synthase
MIKASYLKRNLIFKQPAGTSRGVLRQKDIYYLVLNKSGNSSKTGIGEIAPIPGLSPDAVPGLQEKIEDLVEKINKGKEIDQREFTGFPAIRFGYETALKGLIAESPVLLYPSEFTKGAKGIRINGLIWMGSKEFMLQQVAEKLTAGFTCLKLKIGAIDFESELEILRSIRKRYSAEQLEIRVDANGAFSPGNAIEKLEQLAKFELHSIEQPIKQGQFSGMKKLCKNSPVPVALDEELIGISQKEEKENLLNFVSPQYIILKPTLVGGIKAAEEWISIAEKRRIGWWVTSALESNVGLNAIAQWTATLGTNNFQGLGTGALFTNNIKSPLFVEKGMLGYNSADTWNLKTILG